MKHCRHPLLILLILGWSGLIERPQPSRSGRTPQPPVTAVIAGSGGAMAQAGDGTTLTARSPVSSPPFRWPGIRHSSGARLSRPAIPAVLPITGLPPRLPIPPARIGRNPLAAASGAVNPPVDSPRRTASRRRGRLADPAYRARRIDTLQRRHHDARERALGWARRTGIPVRSDIDGRIVLLIDHRDGDGPLYRATRNAQAAISTAADWAREGPPGLDGVGILAGIWDGGLVRTSHTEFASGRVANIDTAPLSDHATHVAGTMIARGADAGARGMATNATLVAYYFNDDLTDMTARALADPTNSAGKIHLSNHSYGFLAGWEWAESSGTLGDHWYGSWGLRESSYFGVYVDADRDLDQLVYDAVYYLPVKAAGNDRNDTPPSEGTVFYYYQDGAWTNKLYDPATDPLADGQKGGYNTIPFGSVAKNILLVGAVNDAVTGGQRDPSKATQATFSSWGPTDDGRIKPDLVANGVSLRSSGSSGDTAYVYKSGTSMATPNASGSAILLQDHYDRLFPGQFLWASTLKALILHTADSLDDPGPDYRNGWGLMNTRAAIEHLTAHAGSPGYHLLVEDVVDDAVPVIDYAVVWDTVNPLRATLVWTDPPGTPVQLMNATNRMLVNDLDLRIVDPHGTTNYPWILYPGQPTNAAVTGDNVLDVVEQVVIASPPTSGVYRVRVGFKGALTDGEQYFSLAISGQSTQAVHTLDVHSAYGAPVPGTGVHYLLDGTVLTNSVGDVTLETDGDERYAPDGWTMTGHDPTTGSGDDFVMVVTNDATLTWQWIPVEFRYVATAAAGGSVTGASNGWYSAGTVISNTAIPRADCRFLRWAGVASSLTTNNPLVFSLTNAHPNVIARFISLRPDGVVIQFK